MITSKIIDGKGGRNALKVNEEGEITVSVHTYPPIDERVASFPYSAYFENGGSNDMRVNGSITTVSFSIDALLNNEVYIKSAHVKLAAPGAKLSKFANLTPLTNGIELVWRNNQEENLVIHNGIKDNLEFFRLSDQKAEIVDLSGSGADAVIVAIDFGKLFGLPWGLRLKKGSTDSLQFRVRDNLSSGITEFNIIGYGIKI